MRLLEIGSRGEVSLTEDYHDNVPRYAILSHTWGPEEEEVTFEDLIMSKGRNKAGYKKVSFCAKQAEKDGLQYVWIDACCIDRANLTELAEAIASMFRWYHNATKCYVYLSDVPIGDYNSRCYQETWDRAFRHSRWFRRGWTLQELIAPQSVQFFSSESTLLGDKELLERQIHEITQIPLQALRGAPLSHFSAEERMNWTIGRKTTRKEDRAYCLQGIFGVFIPLIYGEGENAFSRLRGEINRSLEDGNAEPNSKRRRIESNIPDDYTSSQSAKNELLDALRFDQIDDRFMNIKPGQTKTCRWLLQTKEYQDWLDTDKILECHGFFWIKGKPGSGKSTLTKFAFMKIKESFRNTILLSFFFNARGTYLEKTTLGLYRSLLVQLLEEFSDDQRLWNATGLTYRSSDDQLKANRESLKHLLLQVVQKLDQRNIMIIIDALDECDEDEVRDMISFFEKVGEDAISDRRKFHVLFSSRHYPHITIARSVEIKLEDQQGHTQDIDKYVSKELKAGRGRYAGQIRQEIRNRASGIFMWVVLVVHILNKAFDRGQVHALQKKLREIPTDLNELFRSILTRDCENLNEMKLCLQWILCAIRPLKREELYFAILSGIASEESFLWDQDAISVEMMNLFILSSSKSLAEITKSKDHTVQFIHESVRDFLLKKDGLAQVWTDLKSNPIGLSHDSLKESCYNYMRSDIPHHLIVPEPLPVANSPPAAELRRDASHKFPFLKYAVHHIFAHADTAGAKGVSQEDFMKDFKLNEWIQLNNIIERHEIRRLTPRHRSDVHTC
ncbi:HET-domain-containing protein [Viridothelium virens]|uniref:HET-domain-containing protein n=1 Tax=Viridothelium virens TaxID=1048519 RepID=A0A6A6GRX2_VIRVR|nr:HET-domain-containing protein [Viridothelium virens]